VSVWHSGIWVSPVPLVTEKAQLWSILLSFNYSLVPPASTTFSRNLSFHKSGQKIREFWEALW
jgi:hypothetical protein